MSINELKAKARELMEVRKEIEELEAMKTAIEDAIKYEMAQTGRGNADSRRLQNDLEGRHRNALR